MPLCQLAPKYTDLKPSTTLWRFPGGVQFTSWNSKSMPRLGSTWPSEAEPYLTQVWVPLLAKRSWYDRSLAFEVLL